MLLKKCILNKFDGNQLIVNLVILIVVNFIGTHVVKKNKECFAFLEVVYSKFEKRKFLKI